jgi:hypothetical protein
VQLPWRTMSDKVQRLNATAPKQRVGNAL